MIGRLRGVLAEKHPPQLLLEVGGVGYEIEAPMSTFYQLPALGEPVTLYTHLVVREDAHLLFGFATRNERALFRSLIKVNGVGAKLALTILSGISANDFARSVHEGDTVALTRLPGIGKKTAERLVIEMRDRLDDWHSGTLPAAITPAAPAVVTGSERLRDAVSALVALGYKPQEASRLVNGLDEGLPSEEIIRAALKRAVKV